MSALESTPYGFRWGSLQVERTASDEKWGYVVTVRPPDGHSPRVEVRVSPAGRVWDVKAVGCDSVEEA